MGSIGGGQTDGITSRPGAEGFAIDLEFSYHLSGQRGHDRGTAKAEQQMITPTVAVRARNHDEI